MNTIKVACVQMDISHCNKDSNLEKALSMAKEALEEGVEIIVFPEVFTTGFCYERIDDISEREPCASIERICGFSKDNGCVIIGSIIEKDVDENGRSKYYNLGFCIEDGEIAGTYRKTHPFGKEKAYFSEGDAIRPIGLNKRGLTIGFEICYEIRFPEIARKLTLSGSDILVTIAEFPHPRGDIWKALATCRAIENQIPHVACNRTGKDPDSSYFGGSIIIDAEGDVLAEAGEDECVIIHEIDLEKKDKVRKAITVFEDRCESLY